MILTPIYPENIEIEVMVSVVYTTGEILPSNDRFTYKPNPVIEEIQPYPLRTIVESVFVIDYYYILGTLYHNRVNVVQ